jgi:hypothetical protein
MVKEGPERRRKLEDPDVDEIIIILSGSKKIGWEACMKLFSCNCRLLFGRVWLCSPQYHEHARCKT